MKGNLRNRLRLIREMEGRKSAGDAAAGMAAVPDTREAASPSSSLPPASMPGWENAGFLTVRRTVTLDFPHTLPPVFPRSLGIAAPDFFGYFSAAGGKAGPESLRFFDLETTGL